MESPATDEIHHVNSDGEVGLPYDILIVHGDGTVTEVDVKLAGVKTHSDPPRPGDKKPNWSHEIGHVSCSTCEPAAKPFPAPFLTL